MQNKSRTKSSLWSQTYSWIKFIPLSRIRANVFKYKVQVCSTPLKQHLQFTQPILRMFSANLEVITYMEADIIVYQDKSHIKCKIWISTLYLEINRYVHPAHLTFSLKCSLIFIVGMLITCLVMISFVGLLKSEYCDIIHGHLL